MTDGGLLELTAIEAAERIAGGHISSEEYTTACLDRIASIENTVHAFIHLDRENALAQACALDEHRRNGAALGALHGVPVAIKDIFDTADFPTECGSPLLKGRRPATDSTAVARLRTAGAVIIGKTVTTEFAYFHPGATRNPRDPARTPGGSSSGSAAAIAAGMVPLAIGSQTNGSVIRPAAFCGIYGIKPSHGLISRAGVLTLSRSLDHVGVFGRSLGDAAFLLDVLAGYDPADPDSRAIAAADHLAICGEAPPVPPRLAFVRTPMWDKAEAATRTAFEHLANELDAQPIDLGGSFAAAWEDHAVIMSVEMAHNLGEIVEKGGEGGSSARLRELMAQVAQHSAQRYLKARHNARRYAAGSAVVAGAALPSCSRIMMRSSRPQRPGSRPRVRPPATRCFARYGR